MRELTTWEEAKEVAENGEIIRRQPPAPSPTKFYKRSIGGKWLKRTCGQNRWVEANANVVEAIVSETIERQAKSDRSDYLTAIPPEQAL